MTNQPLIDFLGDSFKLNPYPVYDHLRELRRIHWSPALHGFVLMHHQDVQAVLTDPRFSTGAIPSTGTTETLLRESLVFRNPPDHTRLRGLIAKAFTPRTVESLRPRVQQLVDELLDAVEGQGRMDFVSEVARPLTLHVIAQMIGVPAEDCARHQQALYDLSRLGDVERSTAAFGVLMDYFRSLIDQKRERPEDDLLSRLIAAHENDDKLSGDELMANTILLFFAGQESTANVLGNGMLALLQLPEQKAALQASPERIKGAVEEMLRFDNSVQAITRIASEDLELAGQKISKGDRLYVCLGAANRDPQMFERPDEFDIHRKNSAQNLSFGQGIHYCLGAALARLEGQVVLETVLRRMPRIELTGGPIDRRNTFKIRGLNSLHLTF